MNVSDTIRTIISRRGTTQSAVARSLGVSQPAIASVLSVGNPQTRVLAHILDSLDYRLVAVPAEQPLPQDAIQIEPAERERR